VRKGKFTERSKECIFLDYVHNTTDQTTIVSVEQKDVTESLGFKDTPEEEITKENTLTPNPANRLVANRADCDEASPSGSIRLAEPSQDPITLQRLQRILGYSKGCPHTAIGSTTSGWGFAVVGPEDNPISYREALRSHYDDKWKSTMGEEFKSLIENKT